MHQDIARGTPIANLLGGLGLQAQTVRLLHRLIASGNAEKNELEMVLAMYARLRSTHVSLCDSYEVEFTWRDADLLERYAGDDYGVTPRIQASRWRPGVSRACDVAESWDAYVARNGGVVGVVERNAQERALWRKLAELAGRPLAERARFIDDGYRRIWGSFGSHRAPSTYIAVTDQRLAEIDATYVAIALRLCRLTRGKAAEHLDQLTPEIIPAVPNDVITGQPFDYVDDGGSRRLRIGEIPCDDPAIGSAARIEIVVD
jgi:hypothetical protein